jgi:ribosomal protein L40E
MKYAVLIAVIVIIIVIILIIFYAASRRRLPKHPSQRPVYTPPSEPPPPPPPQDINLTPKQAPVQQIVIKEVVKVNCRYCGALIDSTAEKCPFCGAPRS